MQPGPHHGGPGPAPPASAFRLSSRPLPPLALCRLHCREHGQRRLPARPLTAQVLSSFPPKRDGEEGHRPSFVRCSSLDQPAGSKGRVPPGWCASCPFETACGEARLPGEGAGASGKGTQGLPGKGAKASGKWGWGFRKRGPRLPGKGAKASGKGGQGFRERGPGPTSPVTLGRTVRGITVWERHFQEVGSFTFPEQPFSSCHLPS